MPTERSCYGIPFVKLWRKQSWNCGLLQFLLKLRPTYAKVKKCSSFSFCINLSFLWSTKETQLMKLCWQPKRKKKACDMVFLLQPQMWTFPCLLHDEVLSLLHHEGFGMVEIWWLFSCSHKCGLFHVCFMMKFCLYFIMKDLTDSLQYILKLSHSAKKRAWDTGAPFVEHRERYTPRGRKLIRK
jgi:hypothetical protein